MRWQVRRAEIAGTIEVPGDKSIAHRSLMLAALANGTSRIRHLPDGQDVLSTARCMGALGAHIEIGVDGAVVRSSGELREPGEILDAGNSGTTMRLLAGILAGQPFQSCLSGDASLQRRPMGRVVTPLSEMGAHILSRDGYAPLEIRPAALRGISYALPVASAQVKSCVLLAGLFAEGSTTVIERLPARDHTERLLAGAGVPVRRHDGAVTVQGGGRPRPFSICVPGDLSSAAFFLAAAALTGGEVTVRGVGVNPTRFAFLDVLRRMGVSVQVRNEREELGEPVADVTVRGGKLDAIALGAADVPALVDEIPLVVLLAAQAEGQSEIRGAEELRVKETDRISAVATSLRRLGAHIEELQDGFVIEGPAPLIGAPVESYGDHRIAMMLAVAGSIADGETTIEGAHAAAVSYPRFAEAWRSLGGSLDEA